MSLKTPLLIVDDSPDYLLQMKTILMEDGFDVVTADTGQAAIESIDKTPPALVLTDLHLPGISGMELMEMLRGTHPMIPVMVTTMEGSEQIAAEALRRGAASYVPKRDIESSLAPMVRQVLSVGETARSVRLLAPYTVESMLRMELINDEALVPAVIARLEMELINVGVFDEGERMQIGMALDEALLNAMIHGNLEVGSELREISDGEAYKDQILKRQTESPYRNRRVHVHLHADRKQAVFTIRDQGPGFDCAKVCDPTDPENIENIGGRGLLMIQAFMDEVHYNETGNEIVMIKRKDNSQ